jgi:hypothetical protein
LSAKNKTIAKWHLINKEFGNSLHDGYKTDLRNGKEIISNPQNISDRLNFFFIEIVNNLLSKRSSHINMETPQQRINYCPNRV